MQARLNQYITGLWLSCCAALLTYALFENKHLPFNYVCFSSLSCLFIYTFPSKLKPSWNMFFSAIILAATALILWQIQPSLTALILIFILGLFSLSYVSPHLLGFQVRNIPYFKAPLVALTWTYLTRLFPILGSEIQMEPLKLVSVFLFFLALTIPFDIRDREKDQQEIKTPAIVMGRTGALWFQFVLLLALTALLLYQNYASLLVGLCVAYLFIVSVLTSSKKDSLLWSLLLDGSIVLFALVFWVY